MSELHQAGLHAAIGPVGAVLAKQIAAKHYCVPDLVDAAVSAFLLTAQPILATTEELEELDAGALVVDAEGKPWLKQEDEGLTWWVTLLSEEGYPATAIALPAQLIRLQP